MLSRAKAVEAGRAVHNDKKRKSDDAEALITVHGPVPSERLIGEMERTWYSVFQDRFVDASVRERGLIIRHCNMVKGSFIDRSLEIHGEYGNSGSGGRSQRQRGRKDEE